MAGPPDILWHEECVSECVCVTVGVCLGGVCDAESQPEPTSHRGCVLHRNTVFTSETSPWHQVKCQASRAGIRCLVRNLVHLIFDPTVADSHFRLF